MIAAALGALISGLIGMATPFEAVWLAYQLQLRIVDHAAVLKDGIPLVSFNDKRLAGVPQGLISCVQVGYAISHNAVLWRNRHKRSRVVSRPACGASPDSHCADRRRESGICGWTQQRSSGPSAFRYFYFLSHLAPERWSP